MPSPSRPRKSPRRPEAGLPQADGTSNSAPEIEAAGGGHVQPEETAFLPTESARPPAAAAPVPASTVLPPPHPAQEENPSDGKGSLEELAGMDASAFESLMASAGAGPKGFEVGQNVTGLVVRLDADNAFIDLGGKAEAQIALSELTPDEAQVGASVAARVLKFRDEGILLARSLGSGVAVPALLADARDTGIPVDGRVESRNEGGYVVNVSGVRAFCPISQIDRIPGRDLDVFVGQTFAFRVIDIRGRDVVVSRRSLQEAEIQVNREKIWETVKIGDLLEGVVTSVRDYGAFVDLGGVEGLVHKTEISWEEVDNPASVLHRWDRVKVRIVEVDRERKRIALSLKDPNAGPWAKVGNDFVEGGIYEGRVVKLADFGAFIELAPGVTGLVRLPNLSWERVEKTSEAAKVGEIVRVRVLEIDRNRERIDLGIRQATPDPAESAADTYPIGSEVTGVVQHVSRAGLTMKVDDMEAWLPGREVQLPPGILLEQRFRKGSRVTARVVEVDRRHHKLKLSQTSSSEAEEREAYKRVEKEQRGGGSSLGTLAELLAGVKVKK
jgi:small subunit ribosomal protein S1